MKARWVAAGLLIAGLLPGSLSAQEPADVQREAELIRRFETILERNPRRGTALDRVYGHHAQNGTLDELVARWRKTAEENEANAAAWMLIGLFESRRGNDSAAIEAFGRAEEIDKQNPHASFYLAESLRLTGDLPAAAEAYRRAIERRPPRAELLDIYRLLGRTLQRSGRDEDALGVWRQLEESFPGDVRVAEQIAAALAEDGQLEEARLRYERLAEASRQDLYRQVTYEIQAADLTLQLGDREAALDRFEQVLSRLKPDSWLFEQVRGKIEGVFRRADDLAGLAEYYAQWIGAHPEDLDAMVKSAKVLSTLGRGEEAQDWYMKAIELAPSDGSIRQAYIDQLVYEKKYAEAIEQYRALSELDPNNPDVLQQWGLVVLKDAALGEGERRDKAAEVWMQLVTARPDDPVTIVQVADLLRQAEVFDSAEELYRRAVELRPLDVQYHEYLGEFLHSRDRKEEAREAWRKLAAGELRTPENLHRLAEVFRSFGFPEDALSAAAEARSSEPKELLYHLTYIELLLQAESFEDAKTAVAEALPLASDLEEREGLMQREIRAHQGAGTLDEAIAELQEQLATADAGQQDAATAEQWLRLARFLDADRQVEQAVAAVEQAVRVAPASIAGHRLLAEFKVSVGALDQATDAYRRLTTIDPQFRSNYLREIARLEARLGRIEEALEAGQDLLAAAPGNAEHYQFYADLCFQLGRADEGLETLRRAVRTDPSDSDQLLRLAAALANQFQTAEAIELYWQAFDKAADLREQLTIVSRLAELHLQQNQFERLVTRLDREGRDDGSDRAATFCIAQAHLQAEDYVAARDKLESYLAENEQDTLLLEQLSRISEQEGDLDSAIEYQERLGQIKSDAGEKRRLAQLLFKSDQAERAETLLAELALEQDELPRILDSADELLAYERFEAAQRILDELARRHPQNWEVMYRQAVAESDTAKAIRLYEQVLALPLDHDEKSAAAKAAAAQRTAGVQSSGVPGASPPREGADWIRRVQYASQIRRAVSLDNERYYVQPGQRPQFWSPSDYGTARMASMAWLLKLSTQVPDEDLDEQLAERFRFTAADGADARERASAVDPHRDALYFAAINNDVETQLQIARHISESGDPDACAFYLRQMMVDARRAGRVGNRGEPAPNAEPLPEDELAHLLECFRRVEESSGEPAASYVMLVMTELEHAGREAEAQELLERTIEAIDEPGDAVAAINLLASRGDVEGVVRIMERAEELSRKQTSGRGRSNRSQLNYMLPQFFSQLTDEEDFDGLLEVLVTYLDWAEADRVAESRGYRRPSRQAGGRSNYVNVYMGGAYRSVQLDFPAPSQAFDDTSLTVLRNAFEFLQQRAQLDGLTTRLAEAAESGRLTHRLARAYCDWWRGERIAAVHVLDEAIRESGGDEELQFQLAHALLAIGEPVAALEQLDGITTLDQASTVRRELAVLGLALQSGAIDRARQAAERLFGLRLASAEQFQLARYMHQLGMHDMANAVLRRIQQSTRGATSDALSLMSAYQQQGKRDEALAIAHQVLRTRPPAQPANNQHDQFRQQALQVIARLGDIKQLIADTEEKLEASPNSARLLKQLADYYQAANEREKARQVYERLAELGPEDAHSRYQAAQMLESMGNRDAAIDHYVRAFALDPSLFSSNYHQIQRTFQQENRLDELAQVFLKKDLSKVSEPYRFVNLVQMLSQNEPHTEVAFRLFERLWDAHPQYRTYMLSSLQNESLRKLPRIYDYARQGVLDENAAAGPWQSLEQIMSWSGDGTITSAPGLLLDVAESQEKLDELEVEIEKAVRDRDGWPAGEALLGLVALRRKEVDEAMARFDALFSERLDEVPPNAAMILGNALESEPKLRSWAVRLYEQAMENRQQFGGLGFDYGPEKRLITLYKQQGRNRQARELLLREATRPIDNQYDPGYSAYQWLHQQAGIGEALVELGYPLDALYVVNAARGETARLRMAEQWGGNLDGQFDQSAAAARQQLKPETLLEYLARSAGLDGAPPAPIEQSESKLDDGSGSSVDLLLYVSGGNTNGEQSIESSVSEIVRDLKPDDPALANIEARLASLAERQPPDVNVLNLWAIVQMRRQGEADNLPALDRLVDYVETTPLPSVEPGRLPDEDARRRARAELALCLAAEECLADPDRVDQGSMLLARALDAAALLKERDMRAAMLRASAKLAIERGDREMAEEHMRQLLDLLLGRETDQPPGTAGVPEENHISGLIGGGIFAAAASWTRPILLSLAMQTEAADAPANASPESGPTLAERLARRQGGRPVDIETFRQIVSLAELSAESGMHDLSLECIREALRGGPPIPATANEMAMQSIGGYSGGYGGSGSYAIAISPGGRGLMSAQIGAEESEVADAIMRLDDRWKREEVAPTEVYETLVAVVLPEGRPNETFLYTAQANRDEEGPGRPRGVRQRRPNLFQSLFGGLKNDKTDAGEESIPDGVSRRLIRRAIEAEEVDDLRRRVRERAEQPLAALPVHILLTHLGLEARDTELAEGSLAWLSERLAQDGQPHTAQRAALAAIPAIKSSEHFAAAAQLVERISAAAEFHNDAATAQQMKMILAQAVIAQGKSDEGLARLRKVSDHLLGSLFDGQGNQPEVRRLAAKLCRQLAEEGDVPEALGMFGRLLDSTDPGHWRADRLDFEDVPPVLLKSLSALEPDARYEHLKDFVLPEDAPVVRIHPWFFRYQPSPAEVSQSDEAKSERDWFRYENQFLPSDMLIAEAQRLGKVEELEREVAALARSHVRFAEELLLLVRIASRTANEPVVEQVRQIAERFRKQATEPGDGADPLQFWADILVARACTLSADERLNRLAGNVWDARPFALGHTFGHNTVGRARYLWAAALAGQAEVDIQSLSGASPLAYWIAAPRKGSSRGGMARVPSLWIQSDGILCHAAGPENDALLFQYPLSGTFQFSFEGYDGNLAEINLGYGDVQLEPEPSSNRMSFKDLNRQSVDYTPYAPIRMAGFNRWTLDVSPERVRWLINGHLVKETRPPTTSPWIGIRACGVRWTFVKNVQITGDPTIPEEVPLVADSSMQGWVTSLLAQRMPAISLHADRVATGGDQALDWWAEDGVLNTRRASESPDARGAGLIEYHRPLTSGDEVRYEFFYKPQEELLYPAIGRLVLALAPDGVHTHWLADVGALAWDGTSSARPAAGEKPALREDDWNTVSLRLDGDRLLVTLNGAEVYQARIGAKNSRRLGFYRPPEIASARARNISLRGEWPSTLPANVRTDLLEPADREVAPAEARLAGHLVGPEPRSLQVGDVLRHAASLSEEERYAYLAEWVLPGLHQDEVRAFGGVRQATAPVVLSASRGESSPDGESHIESPLAMLIETARSLDRLSEVRQRITTSQPLDEHQERAQLAGLLLVAIAEEDMAAAAGRLDELTAVVEQERLDVHLFERWPELVAINAATEVRPLLPAARSLVEVLERQLAALREENITLRDSYVTSLLPIPDRELFARCVAYLRGRVDLADAGTEAADGMVAWLDEWRPASGTTAWTHGLPLPPAVWACRGGTVERLSSHWNDRLYYHRPLGGDFEMICDVRGFGDDQIRLGFDGRSFGVSGDGKSLQVTSLAGGLEEDPLAEPIPVDDQWHTLKLASAGDVLQFWFDDQKLHEVKFGDERDAWLFLYAAADGRPQFRNVRVVDKSSGAGEHSLLGEPPGRWSPYYASKVSPGSDWTITSQAIGGRMEDGERERRIESLLYYHVPMFAGSEIAYEFHYARERALAHPCVGRAALLLASDGVQVHQITDAQYEQNGLDPHNVSEVAHARLTDDPLPLKPDEWNTLVLRFEEDAVTLALNGQDVYRHALTADEIPRFGIFHFADREEAKVRNVVWKSR